MHFYIIDKDEDTRSRLRELIEDDAIGEIVGESNDGALISAPFLHSQGVDTLILGLDIPFAVGMDVILSLRSAHFAGNMIVLSDQTSKELIAKVYQLGVDYVITQPIHPIEITSILQKIREKNELKQTLLHIQTMLNMATCLEHESKRMNSHSVSEDEGTVDHLTRFLLNELNLTGEPGYHDLIEIIEILHRMDSCNSFDNHFPKLKEIYRTYAQKLLPPDAKENDLHREIKACEQRIRRSINHAFIHFSSLGLMDYTNYKFERYASTFFDFQEIRKVMKQLEENDHHLFEMNISINIKKFIQVLYHEVRKSYSRKRLKAT